MKLRCIIVDDEPLAQVVIEKYLERIDSLELVAKCKNALETINFLHTNTVDLIFLDINMPELSGIDLLKTLKHQPKIIFTTAYSEFALESYEYGATDYLLKPIKFDRFLKAVNRVIESVEHTTTDNKNEEVNDSFLFIKQDQTVFKVKLSDILYVEALGNYLQVYTAEKKIITRETMCDFEKRLSQEHFVRIHKSFIVNIGKIEKISNNHVYIADRQISIGTIYKSELMKRLN